MKALKLIIQSGFSLIALLFLFISVSVTAQEVVELKLPKSDKIVIKLMFRNGSMSDPKGKEGLTSLTANLITEGGTVDKKSSEIKDELYPMAAGFNSTVDKEVSIFTFEFHKDFTDKFYSILKGIMLSPRFDEEDFSRVKSNKQNFVDQVIKSSSDEEYSKKALEDLLFRGTNYQHMVDGNSEGVKSITLQDAKEHYRNYFTAKNLTIGIAGNYSPEFLGRLKSDLNQLSQEAPAIPGAGLARTPNGIQVEIVSKDQALGSAIFMGFPLTLTRKNDEFAALMIANSWLGEHRKSYSRLYKKIREERSMNYGDYSYIEWYNNGGQNMLPQAGFPRSSNYFSIWLRPVQTAKGLLGQYKELEGIKIGHAHFAIRMALSEMDKLINKGMTQEDFELTKTFLRSYIKLYIATPSKQLGFLLDSRFYGRKDYIAEMDALLEKVSLEDVNKAIKNNFQTKNMFITIVTDQSEVEALAESLRTNAASPMSYSNSLKAVLTPKITSEDEEVATFPLTVSDVTVVNSKDLFIK
jgi:zinc protease